MVVEIRPSKVREPFFQFKIGLVYGIHRCKIRFSDPADFATTRNISASVFRCKILHGFRCKMIYYRQFLKILLTFGIFSNNIWINSEAKVFSCPFLTVSGCTLKYCFQMDSLNAMMYSKFQMVSFHNTGVIYDIFIVFLKISDRKANNKIKHLRNHKTWSITWMNPLLLGMSNAMMWARRPAADSSLMNWFWSLTADRAFPSAVCSMLDPGGKSWPWKQNGFCQIFAVSMTTLNKY
jgi:hypothetical protein